MCMYASLSESSSENVRELIRDFICKSFRVPRVFLYAIYSESLGIFEDNKKPLSVRGFFLT